jgi:hypothetical protein
MIIDVKTVFWEVNGEFRILDEEEMKKYRKYTMIESEDEKKCDYIGYVKINDFGGFDVEVCASVEENKLIIYISKDWVPAPGYSWSESEVKKISLDIS